MSSEQSSSKPKPFSISFSKPSTSSAAASERVSQASSQASTPRAQAFDSGRPSRTKWHDESEGEDDQLPAHEEVTGFDRAAGGAVNAYKREPEEKRPRVIQVDSNNDWRGKIIRARKSLLPAEVQAQRAAKEPSADSNGQVEVEGPSPEVGLSYAQPRSEKLGGQRGDQDAEPTAGGTTMVDVETGRTATEPETQEDVALQALIRESKGEGETDPRKSNLVIEAQRHTNGAMRAEEEEMTSFRSDVASRPDSASVTDYESVPVEEFGAALLRGMGWKEGERVGKGNYGNAASNQAALKARVPERRPGYLGIGAKDISGKAGSVENEIGAWGKSAMRKAKKPGEGLYTPVLMQSKKTGEKMTEDEFKNLQKEGTKSSEDWKERRDRNLEKHGRDSRRRDFEDDERSDEQRRSSGSPHRNGSLSPDRDGRRGKQYMDLEDERRTDERKYRDRDRDRDRDRRRNGEDDKDRRRGKDKDSRYRSSRRSPDDDPTSRRSSRRHDSGSDRYKPRGSGRDRDRRSRLRE